MQRNFEPVEQTMKFIRLHLPDCVAAKWELHTFIWSLSSPENNIQDGGAENGGKT